MSRAMRMEFLRSTGDSSLCLCMVADGFDSNLFLCLASKGLLFKPYSGYTRET